MLSDDEIRNLPANPKLAFARFVEQAREIRNYESQGREDWQAERKYVANLRAFTDVYDLGISIAESPWNDERFYAHYREIEDKIDYLISRFRLETLRPDQEYSLDQVEFQEDHREEIHKYLNRIRKVINSAEIDIRLKEGIFKKINALGAEVDKLRSNISVFSDAMLELTAATGEAGQNLEPAVKILERVAGVFGRVKKTLEIKKLEKPTEKKLLGPPTDQNEENLDDEIPF